MAPQYAVDGTIGSRGWVLPGSNDKNPVTGVGILSDTGEVSHRYGIANDPQVGRYLENRDWVSELARKKLASIQLPEISLGAFAHKVDEGLVVVLSELPSDVVHRFLTSVDFAYEVLEHVLSDPSEAINIVDTDGNIRFLSPGGRFGIISPGEMEGRPIKDVLPLSTLPEVLKTGKPAISSMRRERGAYSRYPIRRNGKIVGAVSRIMLHAREQIRMLSERVSDLEAEVEKARGESAAKLILDRIVGESPAIMQVKEQILQVAALDIPVLVQGESGTGKELVVQALHRLSSRRQGSFVAVNAAALPESLVESELFGYAPGSFTGADRKGKKGKFELADGGTIFLDEIGDMPLAVQAKLLRVLQDKRVDRVGDSTPKKVDFRLCSATNRDLEAIVAEDKFRLDLFFRVSPFVIEVPTLSERLEDIPLLISSFLLEISGQYDRKMPMVDDGVFDYLGELQWPGNVRQLKHEVERAFIFMKGDTLCERDFRALKRPQWRDGNQEIGDVAPTGSKLKDRLGLLEEKIIHETMMQFGGNKKRVAEHLGISRGYLYKKLDGTEEK